jgi:hypothetical protein
MKYRMCVNQGCRFKAIDATIPSAYEYVEGRHITLFGWTVLLYKEKTEYQTDICLQCSIDEQTEKERLQ